MGKSSPKPPDYGPVAAASEEAARIMGELGRDQLDFAKQQYQDVSPLLQRIAAGQEAAQNQQMDQAQDYYNYQRGTYHPLERQMVADAENFDTGAHREYLASQAAADAGLAFSNTQAANERAMMSMGVNPNSGRFAGIQAAGGLSVAANRASAMTGTRMQASQLGHARKMDAAGLGRNLAGASTGAYAGATAAGSAAGQSAQSAGQNYMGNMAIGSGTIGAGQEMRIGGLSSVLNAQTNAYINGPNDSLLGTVGGLAGVGAGLYQTGMFSDRRLKENIREVGVDPTTHLALYEFTYKDRPGTKYIGVMADEVVTFYPDAVFEKDGYFAVDYDMLGIELKEVT